MGICEQQQDFYYVVKCFRYVWILRQSLLRQILLHCVILDWFKKKKKKTLSGGKYLENVLPLTSAVLSPIPAINNKGMLYSLMLEKYHD